MSDWQPTMSLRFVERPVTLEKTVRILQQQWERELDYGMGTEYEWRDVPEVRDE